MDYCREPDMQQFYETVQREQQWHADGCPEPAPRPPVEISERDLKQIFG